MMTRYELKAMMTATIAASLTRRVSTYEKNGLLYKVHPEFNLAYQPALDLLASYASDIAESILNKYTEE